MLIDVKTESTGRVWHHVLATALAASGHAVRFDRTGGPAEARRNLQLLLRVERRAFTSRCHLFEPWRCVESAEAWAPDSKADLSLILAGPPPNGGDFIEPVFNGEAGEDALIAALLGGLAPVVVVRGVIGGSIVELAVGRPAMNDRFVLSRALNNVLPRLVTLLAQAVGAVQRHEIPAGAAVESGDRPTWPRRPEEGVERPAAVRIARGIQDRLQRRRKPWRRRPRWAVAYRMSDDVGAAGALAFPEDGFVPIADDGQRFYADPFAFEHDGRSHIFVEDYPYATRKGVITCFEITGDRQVSPPRTVLEKPYHLSYPLVLRHGEAIYMLPETGATRRLQLFRADRFPDRWVEDQILLDDIGVADATPTYHDGQWWLFAALIDGGGSPWDALGLFYAPDLLGPWTPHPNNPVLIDAGSSRPAGAMWHEDGVLMRVAQDGRDGYGMGITICRVDRLDRVGFAQTVVACRGAPNALGARGTHTLNRYGRLEVIDLNRSYVG